MKIFNDLKRHMWVIIVISIVATNTYSIQGNAIQLNSNANATKCLANGVEVLADATTDFIRTYIENRTLINNKLGILTSRELDNRGEIITNAGEIQINRGEIIKNINSLLNIIKQPTYKYLKSVTVFVCGQVVVPIAPEVNADANPVILHKKMSSWCGTGVIVKQDFKYTYILTNRHVAGGYQPLPVQLTIRNDKGEYIPAEIVKLNDKQDLAILKVEGRLIGKSVIRGLSLPTIAEKVYTVGQPLGMPFMYGEGIFSGTIPEHDIYQLPCIGGQSGSGVFNADGELLGMIYSGNGYHTQGRIQWDNTRANVVKGYYIAKFIKEILG